ncbi:hypothetical protein HZP89_14060 [Elizabethkingia anophelis]|nr:hypothetical protein [Elizabethkingia anophelis]
MKNYESYLKRKKTRIKKPDFKNITHRNMRAKTVIDGPLWDSAKWKAFGSFAAHGIPFGLMLTFENGEAGKKIFENWIHEYGNNDTNDIITLTIIKGVDKNNPFWYKVLVNKNVNKENLQDGDFVSMASRFHMMEPKDDINLTRLINNYEHFKKYILVPAQIDKDFNITPFFELGILKTQLKIMNAWEIGLHDSERVVIRKNDNPIIPDHITDAPILEVLKEINEKEL